MPGGHDIGRICIGRRLPVFTFRVYGLGTAGSSTAVPRSCNLAVRTDDVTIASLERERRRVFYVVIVKSECSSEARLCSKIVPLTLRAPRSHRHKPSIADFRLLCLDKMQSEWTKKRRISLLPQGVEHRPGHSPKRFECKHRNELLLERKCDRAAKLSGSEESVVTTSNKSFTGTLNTTPADAI